MRRSLFASGSFRILNLFVLALLVAVTAFEMGRARAARGKSDRRRTPVVEAVRHAAPAVVNVFAQRRKGRNVMIQSSGAGVIVHPAGYIITNSHVVRGGQTVSVELFGTSRRVRAQVIADLPANDLALLRIQSRAALPYVSIARTNDVMLGEAAIAVGNPRGLGDTITVGVVSALGRDAKLSGGASLRNLIQTDASINNGNSGGALLNLDGELMGVIVSLMPSSDGIAFAIPGDQVRALLHRALGGAPAAKKLPESARPATPTAPRVSSSIRSAPGRAAPATPGVLPPPAIGKAGRGSAIKTTPLRAEDFGLTVQDTGTYLQVTRVVRDGPAYRAGVITGDIISTIDGRPARNELDLVLAFSATKPGKVYNLELRRSGQQRSAALVTP